MIDRGSIESAAYVIPHGELAQYIHLLDRV